MLNTHTKTNELQHNHSINLNLLVKNILCLFVCFYRVKKKSLFLTNCEKICLHLSRLHSLQYPATHTHTLGTCVAFNTSSPLVQMIHSGLISHPNYILWQRRSSNNLTCVCVIGT